MNQIEFIKKWAKVGDRIQDVKRRYLLATEPEEDGVVHYSFWQEGVRFGLERVEDINWQSPKIYRLKDSIDNLKAGASFDGYIEQWHLVADYADVEKEKEQKETLYEIVSAELSSRNNIRNVVCRWATETESRLKALEAKVLEIMPNLK